MLKFEKKVCRQKVKTGRLILFREITAVYSETHTKHMNTLREQNGDFSVVESVTLYFKTLHLELLQWMLTV